MSSMKHIAVIGAGPSGLAAIKCCKDEGLAVTCFEKTAHIGGRWCYREAEIPGVASIMKTTSSLYSKEMLAFSDFPPSENFPNYMHHEKMLQYLKLYADKFSLSSCIKYQHEVIWISPNDDYEKTGKWLLTFKNLMSGSESSEAFDGVLICSGRTSHPYIPSFPTLDKFHGQILHSHSVKSPTKFENLDVLVVGSGNSAVDTAVEISTFATQVYLSTRNGFWLYPKLGQRGLPFDFIRMRRYYNGMASISSRIVNKRIENYLESKLNHETYKLKPSHRALDCLPTINEDLPDKILTGRVQVKGIITEVSEDGVYFEDEETSTKADVIIFATGYETKIPFLDDKYFKSNDDHTHLYKHIFPLGIKHPTLAVIGFVQSNGPIAPISELQCRWATRIFNRKQKLPDRQTMESCIQKQMDRNKDSSSKLEEDFITYMDDLAKECGAKPSISTLLFKDPTLFWLCMTGPFLPYQYRLTGPHSWNGARQAILECSDRMSTPLDTRIQEKIIPMKIFQDYKTLTEM